MGIVMDFQERQRHKQLDFERRALQDLSFEKIEKAIHRSFDLFIPAIPSGGGIALEMCAEYALEAFLLGSSMSRFGFYGENRETAYERCEASFARLLDDFCDFWQFWMPEDTRLSDLRQSCERYLREWWTDGFETSLKRWKLKLR
ncbi:DUF2521 family protein [Sporolactobacillus shoreae]|uniref:DUF2521 family protein n=1 Tax=Sporolactobacillus shoreae TaxID=1465501 RepID=A0A4Z0GJ45_9BACL|nr:DUF2521 family protein [Sporolactobacillus shoreae]TGA96801.1 DUF2521 family protein [Sporolactobacillus shoreae]